MPVKVQKKIFQGQEALVFYLEKYELFCLYSSLDVAITLKALKLKEQVDSILHLAEDF